MEAQCVALKHCNCTSPSATILLNALANIILKYALLLNPSNHSQKEGKKSLVSRVPCPRAYNRSVRGEGNAPTKYLRTLLMYKFLFWNTPESSYIVGRRKEKHTGM